MTKLILILFIFLLSSCYPRFLEDNGDPFIVEDISAVFSKQKDICKYSCDAPDQYSIIAPCGMFNIGDTIRLTK